MYFKILFSLFSFVAICFGKVYQLPQNFLSQVFPHSLPLKKVLHFDEDLKKGVDSIMGHSYPIKKVCYWRNGERSAWILEEIGKVKPITVGLAVDSGRLQFLKVLIYRESHGWEVRYPSFLKQFDGIALNERGDLTSEIRSISGATLSVNALRNLANLALFLHNATSQK